MKMSLLVANQLVIHKRSVTHMSTFLLIQLDDLFSLTYFNFVIILAISGFCASGCVAIADSGTSLIALILVQLVF